MWARTVQFSLEASEVKEVLRFKQSKMLLPNLHLVQSLGSAVRADPHTHENLHAHHQHTVRRSNMAAFTFNEDGSVLDPQAFQVCRRG